MLGEVGNNTREAMLKSLFTLLSEPNPHWAVPTGISLSLGLLVPQLPKVVTFFRTTIQDDPIVGDWNVTHSTFGPDGSQIIKHRIWKIRPRRLTGDCRVTVFRETKKPIFLGTLISTEMVYNVHLKGSHHEEYHVQLSKMFHNQDLAYGIWVGLDHRPGQIAAPMILSKDTISEDDFRAMIQRRYGKSLSELVISDTMTGPRFP